MGASGLMKIPTGLLNLLPIFLQADSISILLVAPSFDVRLLFTSPGNPVGKAGRICSLLDPQLGSRQLLDTDGGNDSIAPKSRLLLEGIVSHFAAYFCPK